MKILALEFSSPQRSVAVVHGGADAGLRCLGEAIETGTRSTKALGLVEEALRQAQAEGIFGRVEIVIDAQRNEFYLAGYDLSAESRREIEPLRLVAAAEVEARQQAGGMIVGPEVTTGPPDSPAGATYTVKTVTAQVNH